MSSSTPACARPGNAPRQEGPDRDVAGPGDRSRHPVPNLRRHAARSPAPTRCTRTIRLALRATCGHPPAPRAAGRRVGPARAARCRGRGDHRRDAGARGPRRAAARRARLRHRDRAGRRRTTCRGSVTKDGRRAVHQPAPESKDGLDPLKAAPRLAQIYDPTTATVYIIDFRHVPIEVLEALEHRPLIIHNAAFEHAMLAAQGVRLRRTYCTLQMARLAYGAERGGLRLAEIAAELLDLELPKDEQVSRLARRRACRKRSSTTPRSTRSSHSASPASSGPSWTPARATPSSSATPPCRRSPPCASPASRSTARSTSRRSPLGSGLRRGARRVRRAHRRGAAAAGRKRSDWLEARLPEDMLLLVAAHRDRPARARSADLDRLAAVPEIRPLLEVTRGQAPARVRPQPARARSARTAGCAWTSRRLDQDRPLFLLRSQSPAAAARRAQGGDAQPGRTW